MRRIWLKYGLGLTALGAVTTLVAAGGCKHTAGHQQEAGVELVSLEQTQKADVQVAVARTLEAKGQTREAVAMLGEAVKNDPRRADAWVRLAVNCDKEGMFVESADYYQKAIALDPRNADTHCNLGYSLYLQERLPEAEAALQRALKLNPEHARARNNLGLVLAGGGREAEALEAFVQAGGSKADAHTNLAYGLTLRGATKEADAHYQQAVALDSNAAAAKKGRTELAAVKPKFVEPLGTPSPVVQAQSQSRGTAPKPTPGMAKIVPLFDPPK